MVAPETQFPLPSQASWALAVSLAQAGPVPQAVPAVAGAVPHCPPLQMAGAQALP